MAPLERVGRGGGGRLRRAAVVGAILLAAQWLVPPEATVSASAGSAVLATAPRVQVEDVDGNPRALPDPRRPIVVVYEDKDSGAQNPAVHALLDRVTDLAANRARFEVVPIADVEDYSFKMARPFVVEHLRKEMKRKQIVIYCDWTGGVRKAWRLQKNKSSILLIEPDGRVLFDGQGSLTPTQIARFASSLATLGVDLPR